MAAWLKRNWYIPLFLVGVAIAIVIGRLPSTNTPPTGEETSRPVNPQQQALQDEFDSAKIASRGLEPTRVAEKTTDEIMAEHEAKLETDISPDESAALLAALGNLHRQKKRDYATAARYFEELIENYPEWPGVNGVYHQLISCYTELNDQESLRLLYRKMVEVFPEDSNEYEYAQHELANP